MEELLVELVNPETFQPTSCCMECRKEIIVKSSATTGRKRSQRGYFYDIYLSRVLVCDSETEELTIMPAYLPKRHKCDT